LGAAQRGGGGGVRETVGGGATDRWARRLGERAPRLRETRCGARARGGARPRDGAGKVGHAGWAGDGGRGAGPREGRLGG
jgi:hypothetical protein